MANLILPALVLAGMLVSIAGWFTNVFWTFSQTDPVNLILGIVGIFVPFVGSAHGVWLWL